MWNLKTDREKITVNENGLITSILKARLASDESVATLACTNYCLISIAIGEKSWKNLILFLLLHITFSTMGRAVCILQVIWLYDYYIILWLNGFGTKLFVSYSLCTRKCKNQQRRNFNTIIKRKRHRYQILIFFLPVSMVYFIVIIFDRVKPFSYYALPKIPIQRSNHVIFYTFRC